MATIEYTRILEFDTVDKAKEALERMLNEHGNDSTYIISNAIQTDDKVMYFELNNGKLSKTADVKHVGKWKRGFDERFMGDKI